MRGRIATVLCALASGAILTILFLGTRAPLGQVVRQEAPDVKDRVADNPDSWRDDLWKIADDLHERAERGDQAGEEMIDRRLDVENAAEAVEEVRPTEEIAQMALKTYTERTAPRRTKDLQEEIAHADGLLKLAKAYLKAEEEKPKPETDVGVAERNWYHYNAEKAQFTLDKAKMAVEVFKNYESKKEMFALRAAVEKAKAEALAAKRSLLRAEEKAKTAGERLNRITISRTHDTKANDALTKALDLESKWRAARDSKKPLDELQALDRAAKAAVVETRSLWRDAKIDIARELRSKHE